MGKQKFSWPTPTITLMPGQEQMVVQATSRAAASGLVKKIDFNPQKYRYLRWSWKIDHPIAAGR